MRKLAWRIAIFAGFLLVALNAEGLMASMGISPDAAARAFGRGASQSLAWISGAFAVIAAIDLFFWRGVVARLAGRPVPPLLKSVFAVVVLVLAIAGIVGIVFHQDITGFWATSGIISIVLGFALRNMLQDIVTGIAINLDGAIKTGDWVALHHRDFRLDKYGQVVDIGWRVSRVQLEDNNVVMVPNSLMGMMAVTNFAPVNHTSRLEVEIVVDFDVPPERARRVLLAGARSAIEEEGILADPAPTVLVGQATERGVAYKVRFWGRVSTRPPSVLVDAVMSRLLKHLRVAGLTPAYPKEDVFYARRPKRLLEHDNLSDRLEVLSRTDLFARVLEREELELLANNILVDTVAPGGVLVRQGDPAEFLFLVAEGILDVFVNQSDSQAPVLVGNVNAGQIFGEMSLLTGEARTASVIANTSVVLYEIKQAHFETVLANRPGIADQISALVAERRVAMAAATAKSSADEIEAETRRLKKQILDKMKSVFVVLLTPIIPRPRAP